MNSLRYSPLWWLLLSPPMVLLLVGREATLQVVVAVVAQATAVK